MDAHSESNERKPVSLDNTNTEINFFASTNFRNTNRKFGIKLDDRRRHMYVVGKTGMGKTTLLENMVLNDIYAGHGVGVVDPHGDFAEKIIDYIPPNRINDVVYFNPSDIDYPIGFNILETIDPRYRHLVASGLMGVFKKIWPDVWSARMEYILNNTLLALLEFPNTTLLGINRLLADDAYRKRVVRNLKDPVIRSFWETEFAGYNDRYKQEAVAPVQNKIGQFLSASVIRNIVAQVRSRINIREIMDTKKIFIMNLSKGRIGEDNSRLLGGMLITKIQLAAMERVDTIEKDRKDFFLYVDEFQNFATESFSNILSEARKYRLDLIMAHQYMEQLDETVLAAVIGNVGTLVTFRVGSTDAEILAKEFAPTFLETDLVNLTKFQIYLKLMIDGVASQPFSANTLSPINLSTGSLEKVVRVSRERYATNRENIEDKIMRWTGIDSKGSDADAEDGSDDRDEDYTEDEEGMPVRITPIKKEVPEPVEPPPPVPPPSKPAVVTAPPVAREPEKKPEPVVPQKPKQDQPKPQSQPQSGRNDNNKKNNNNQNNQNNNKNKDRDRNRDRNKQQNSEKNKKPLDIRQSTPVALVDAGQKGISLSQAMQTNKQAVPVSEPFKFNNPQMGVVQEVQEVYDEPKNSEQESVLVPVSAEPVISQSAPIYEEKREEAQVKPIPPSNTQDVSEAVKGHSRHSSGHIPPNKVVKIDDSAV
ncbi:MAG: type IV secretion system DNA-binding domain-containing protein [Candidatus Magasanikbacteria bacterium]|nr:type IV secretion system DNA-binding domain-containing protein [Candidatus Magasanikbacteria bacterium]